MKKYRVLWVIIIVVAGIGFYSCNKSETAFNAQGGLLPTNYIQIKDSGFSPDAITVVSGSSITFINKTAIAHQLVTDDTLTFKSKLLPTDSSFFFKKDTFGTFPYHCINHPSARGVIIITP